MAFALAGSQPRGPFTAGRVLAAAVAALVALLLVLAALRPSHRDQLVAGLTTAVGSLRPRAPELAPLPPCNATAVTAPEPAVAPQPAAAAQPVAPASTATAAAALEAPPSDSNATRLIGGAVPQLPQVRWIPQCASLLPALQPPSTLAGQHPPAPLLSLALPTVQTRYRAADVAVPAVPVSTLAAARAVQPGGSGPHAPLRPQAAVGCALQCTVHRCWVAAAGPPGRPAQDAHSRAWHCSSFGLSSPAGIC